MKPHYKKLSDGKWGVFESRGDKLPLMVGIETLWGAGIEWKRWVYVEEILNREIATGGDHSHESH